MGGGYRLRIMPRPVYVSLNSYFLLQTACKVILNVFLWLTYSKPLQAGAYITTCLLSLAHRQLGTFQSYQTCWAVLFRHDTLIVTQSFVSVRNQIFHSTHRSFWKSACCRKDEGLLPAFKFLSSLHNYLLTHICFQFLFCPCSYGFVILPK